MRVFVRRLELADFRNYESFVLEPAEGLTILAGPNAVGKTNLIEAMELVTEGASFRGPAWSEVVRRGAERAVVANHARTEIGGDLDIALAVEEGRRRYTVNGVKKRAVTDAVGLVPAVVFTPDDLRVIKEGADKRRAAVDAIGSQVSRAYARLKAEYDRVLRQRNALLKEADTSDEELGPWTELLAKTGAELTRRREGLVGKMADHVGAEYEALSSGESLGIEYASPWKGDAPAQEAEMLTRLHERGAEERARRTTLVGPHRDDVVFEIEGSDARAYASQGQQRTAALAWKLAELAVIEEISGTVPLLLLDDVMSELDVTRRHALAERVGTKTQTIMTTTNLGYFDEDLIREAAVVELGRKP